VPCITSQSKYWVFILNEKHTFTFFQAGKQECRFMECRRKSLSRFRSAVRSQVWWWTACRPLALQIPVFSTIK
jgi:hypothetical protein